MVTKKLKQINIKNIITKTNETSMNNNETLKRNNGGYLNYNLIRTHSSSK